VRQSYLRFLEATLAWMFAASLTYAQTASGSIVRIITGATGAFLPNAQVTTFRHVPRSKGCLLGELRWPGSPYGIFRSCTGFE